MVQAEPLGEADLQKCHQQGLYTVAADGARWGKNFVNVWKTAFSPDGASLAAETRLSLYDYTIAVNGTPWGQTFGGVWSRCPSGSGISVAAPVRIRGSGRSPRTAGSSGNGDSSQLSGT